MLEAQFIMSRNIWEKCKLFFRLLISGLVCALVPAGLWMWLALNEDVNSVTNYNEPNFETACLLLIMGAPIIIVWQLLPVVLMAGAAMASLLRCGRVQLAAVLLIAPFATLLAWIPKLAGLEIEADYLQFLALECSTAFGLWGAARYFVLREHGTAEDFRDSQTIAF
jgi:hypothetical protein